MNAHSLLTALALAMLLEGLLLFTAPGAWRRAVSQLLQMKDGQLRFFGLLAAGGGLLLLWLA